MLIVVNELKAHVLAAAAKAGLEVYALDEILSLRLLTRTLKFCAVTSGMQPQHSRRVEVRIVYLPEHSQLAEEREEIGAVRGPDLYDKAELEVELEYVLLSPASGLSAEKAEALVAPLLAALNDAVGAEHQAYHSNATNYRRKVRAHEVKVLDLYRTSVIDTKLDLSCFATIARALRSIRA